MEHWLTSKNLGRMRYTKLRLMAKRKYILWNNIVVIDYNGLFVYRRVQPKSSKPTCHFFHQVKIKFAPKLYFSYKFWDVLAILKKKTYGHPSCILILVLMFSTLWWIFWIFVVKCGVNGRKNVHYVHDRDTKVRTLEVDHVVVKVYNKMHVEYKVQVEWRIDGLKRKWKQFMKMFDWTEPNYILNFFWIVVLIIHFLHRKHMDFTYKVINDYIMRK